MDQGTKPPGNRPSVLFSGAVTEGAEGLPYLHSHPVAAWVASLVKAARAFVLYDPGNAVIRQFLADYAEKSKPVLARGDLKLEIAPYEISCGGEVIYREHDRERSLAFRLFRDGVRGLTVDSAVHWEELLLLLQILAIRYSGIQQQEEDSITLFGKAEFHGIAFNVVHGFTSDDEEPTWNVGPSSTTTGSTPPSNDVAPELAQAAGAASAVASLAADTFRSAPPLHWDEPLPKFPPPVAVAYQPVPLETLQDLCADEVPEALPAAALAAVRDLLAEAARLGKTQPNPGFNEFVREVRLFLLAEGELVSVMELAGLVGRHQGGAAFETDLLRELGDPRTVKAILSTVPDDESSPPPKMAAVLGLIRLDAILDLLVAEKRPARRSLLLGLARDRLPADGDTLLARFSSMEPAIGLELLSTFAERYPEHATRNVGPLLAHPAAETRLGALKILESTQGELPSGPLLKLLRTAADEGTRIRVLRLLGTKGEPSAFEGIERWVEEHRDLPLLEVEAAGRALAQLAPIAATRLFTRWLRPEKRVLKALRDAGQRRTLVWAAVAGLGVLPGMSAQQQLGAVAQDATGELRRHCLATLARRRREGVPHG